MRAKGTSLCGFTSPLKWITEYKTSEEPEALAAMPSEPVIGNAHPRATVVACRWYWHSANQLVLSPQVGYLAVLRLQFDFQG